MAFSTISGDLLGDDRLPSGTRNDNSTGLLWISTLSPEAIRLDSLRFVGSDQHAALVVRAQNLEVERCTFAGNYGMADAGAVVLINQTLPEHRATFDSCRFIDNRGGFGGAIHSGGSHQTLLATRLIILNSQFIGNIGRRWVYHHGLQQRVRIGGAVFNSEDDSITRIVNCSFLDNEFAPQTQAEFLGFAGLYADARLFELRNNTFANALSESGAYSVFSTLDPADGHVFENNSSAWTDPNWSATNVPAAPAFVDIFGPDGVRATGDEDLGLRSVSPCIDTADASALPATILLDLGGSPRWIDDPRVRSDSILDMGAHERQ